MQGNDQINQLLEKLNILLKRQEDFSSEIESLRIEINNLQSSGIFQMRPQEEIKEKLPVTGTSTEIIKEKETVRQPVQIHAADETKIHPADKSPKIKSDWEEFIGENLINKIGIAITVIGVAIGAKYSIDHNLISPLTRIILGYMAGIALLVFGIQLRKKYENYSAVLVSGSMAIMYFISYYAYSFYNLIPQVPAFILMVIFTAFTVGAAISYNKQVIAVIGLVGAYAVPFLLSEGSGRAAILFSYMAITNAGILVISFRKYWKHLYYSSFGFTWLIYYIWYISKYQFTEHFTLALIFLSIFFLIFYLSFLAYKLLQKDKLEIENIFLLLANSFIFFGIGYSILDEHRAGTQLLGLFTAANAFIHFIVSAVVYRQKLADKNLFYLVSGLVLVFITIAIPVQLDSNWVTLLWAGESALLFWIGKTKNVPLYEKLSYALMLLAFISILQDWAEVYELKDITPLLNINFLTSLIVIAAFAFITYLQRRKDLHSAWDRQKTISKIISVSLPAILIFLIYYALRMEIVNYWDQLYNNSSLKVISENQYPLYYRNYDLLHFKTIWIINYSLAFVSILSFLNIKKFRNRLLGLVNLALNSLIIAVFLTLCLYLLSELRESYLRQTLSEYYERGIFNIWIRYISIAFAAVTIAASYIYTRQDFIKQDFKMSFDIFLHTSVLWILSSELIHWMDVTGSAQSYKLGLTILWGIYSMFMIIPGIWKKKKYLRVASISLFGITLIKLFSYDLSDLDTIDKTIVFLLLGILLLIISFLYNKYKHIIFNNEST